MMEDGVPSLSELCASAMMENTDMDEDEKVELLENLRNLARERVEAIEEEEDDFFFQEEDEVDRAVEEEKKRERAREERKMAEEEDREWELEAERKYRLVAEQGKKRRANTKKMYEWKQKWTQLVHRGAVADRERDALLRSARLSHDSILEVEVAELGRFESELARRREKDKLELDTKLSKAKWSVRRLGATIEEMGAGQSYLVAVQQQMDSAESAIALTKSSQRTLFEQLVELERKLGSELDEARGKMEKEDEQDKASKRNEQRSQVVKKFSKFSKTSPCSSNKNKESDNIGREIKEIDASIDDMGGINGGWDERDHAVFMRCLSRSKVPDSMLVRLSKGECSPPASVERLAEKINLEVPAMNLRSCNMHIRWYGSYLSLLERKKSLVSEWKRLRTNKQAVYQRERRLDQEQADPNAAKPKKRLTKEQRLQQQQDAERRKKSIEEWRSQKLQESERQKRMKQAAEQAEKERFEEKRRQRAREREQIALYKLEKEADKQQRQRLEAELGDFKSTAAAAFAPRLTLKERQQRSLEAANKRRALIHKKAQQQDRAARIAKLKVKPAVRSDFSSSLRRRQGDVLTQSTAAFQSKSLTPEQLGELQERRARAKAHDAPVASAAGVGSAGHSYSIGVRGMVSGRSVPSWKR